MKKIKYRLVELLILVVCSGSMLANSPDSLFASANNKYSAEQYVEAVQMYETVVRKGFESAELYYNLANSYYKLRNYPRAILNYERALQLDPNNTDVLYNLNKARLYNVDKIEVIPEFVLRRFYVNIVGMLGSNSWALISLVMFVLVIGLLFVYLLSSRIYYRRISFFGAIVLLLLSVSCFMFSGKVRSMQTNSDSAIVLSPTVTVKGSPNSNSTDLFIIHEGTKVYLIDKLGDWYEIKLSDGNQGWLRINDVEPI